MTEVSQDAPPPPPGPPAQALSDLGAGHRIERASFDSHGAAPAGHLHLPGGLDGPAPASAPIPAAGQAGPWPPKGERP